MQYLQAAYEAWMQGGDLRARRKRYKDYTYGRQWSDLTQSAEGRTITEYEAARLDGARPMTNNMIRQMVKCVTGNFRRRLLDTGEPSAPTAVTTIAPEIADRNNIDELDSRMLEEFLISGCAIQRVVTEERIHGSGVWIDNVSPDRFFVNRFTDPRGHDIELIGMLHDYSMRETVMRFGHGDSKREAHLAKIYGRIEQEGVGCNALGGELSAGFFAAPQGRCRVIELWTLESRSVVKCHDRHEGRIFLTPESELPRLRALNSRRRKHGMDEVSLSKRRTARWHCRYLTPTGEVIDEFDSPYRHGLHPFVVKFYPLTDGEVHSFVEDIIDQQRYINRIITLIDHIMSTSAKGVLLFPSDRKEKDMSWADVERSWARPGGVIPLASSMRGEEPHQLITTAEHSGAYRLLDLQMKLFGQITGVNEALQGRLESSNASAALYQSQVQNATVAILDLLESFCDFRRKRDLLVAAV